MVEQMVARCLRREEADRNQYPYQTRDEARYLYRERVSEEASYDVRYVARHSVAATDPLPSPCAALVVSCNGRGAHFHQPDELAETSGTSAALPPGTPLSGFFACGEYAGAVLTGGNLAPSTKRAFCSMLMPTDDLGYEVMCFSCVVGLLGQ